MPMVNCENDEDVFDDKDIVQSSAPHAWGSQLMTSVMSSLTHGGLPHNYQAGIKSQNNKQNKESNRSRKKRDNMDTVHCAFCFSKEVHT